MKIFLGWSSHLPLLIEAFNATEGDVLELGIGIFSTPLLHWLCFDSKRKLFSYESEPKYFTMLRSYFSTPTHQAYLVEDWDKTEIERPWGMAFIDHVDYRRETEIRRLAKWAKIIVVHDTDPKYNKFYMDESFTSLFKYRYDYVKASPNTSAFSNFIDLKFLA